MGGEAEKIAAHCQAEIALETDAWECARLGLAGTVMQGEERSHIVKGRKGH